MAAPVVQAVTRRQGVRKIGSHSKANDEFQQASEAGPSRVEDSSDSGLAGGVLGTLLLIQPPHIANDIQVRLQTQRRVTDLMTDMVNRYRQL